MRRLLMASLLMSMSTCAQDIIIADFEARE